MKHTLLFALLLTACDNKTVETARHLRDRLMPGGTCVHQIAHPDGGHVDDVVLCTDGKMLLICVEGSPCITVHAPAEVGAAP
jgi:hypothetical protein